MKSEIQWVIVGKYGVYYKSNCPTRKDAIEDHCTQTGKSWEDCLRLRGDRAVKVRIEAVRKGK
jgi:hypothetical protein